MMTHRSISGCCRCGALEYSVKDDFLYAGYCHCSKCRKATGACGNAIGAVSKENFTLIKGLNCLSQYKGKSGSVAYFCCICGSGLYSDVPNTDVIHIRYGSFNERPTLLPQAHIYVASKADWYEITDALPQFEEGPVGS